MRGRELGVREGRQPRRTGQGKWAWQWSVKIAAANQITRHPAKAGIDAMIGHLDKLAVALGNPSRHVEVLVEGIPEGHLRAEQTLRGRDICIHGSERRRTRPATDTYLEEGRG